MTQKIVLCKLIVFLGIQDASVASVKRNIELIDSLLVSFFQEKTVGLVTQRDTVSIICDLDDKTIQNYVLQVVGNLLYSNSGTVFRNYNPRSAFQGIVIDINEVRPRVEYSSPYNKSPVTEAFVRRTISILIAGQIYSAKNSTIINTLDENLIFQDEIAADAVDDVDESPYEFAAGIRTHSGAWDTYFEPVLLVSTLGVIVYLFFSQRF